jgi:hypothetical protein
MDSEIRADRLRSEIAQLEARYGGLFPPGIYSAFESLGQDRRTTRIYGWLHVQPNGNEQQPDAHVARL